MNCMSYTALYRQFRPRVFEEVVGQEHITTTLKNQIMSGRIAHAYLFTGTRGTGKTSTAKIFSRAVNCLDNSDGNPCNTCSICERALEGKLIDIIEIDAASNRGVDEIRDLREKVKYHPTEGKYRVYIVDEVHMLTVEAFNALLKTLEEPPSHVIFILATTEPHRLPATILSRCQRFDFKRISIGHIVQRLEYVLKESGFEAEQDAIRLIAETADGAMRDALSLLDQCTTFQEGSLTLEKVVSVLGMANKDLLLGISEAIFNRDAQNCMKLVDRAAKEGKDIGQLFKDIILHFRDMMIAKVSPLGLADITRERLEILLGLAETVEVNTIIRIINVLTEAEARAKWSAHPRIFLEVALIKLCQPSMDSTPEGLEERVRQLEEIILKGETVKIKHPKSKVQVEQGPAAEVEDNNSKEPKDNFRDAQLNEEKKSNNSIVEAEEGQNPQADVKVDLNMIKIRWTEVLKYLEKNKKGLYTLIQKSKPVELKGSCLIIGCDALHGIYYEIANSKDNIEALKDAVSIVSGNNLDIKIENLDGTFDRPDQESAVEDFDLVEEAIKVFGEDLVEVIEEEDI